MKTDKCAQPIDAAIVAPCERKKGHDGPCRAYSLETEVRTEQGRCRCENGGLWGAADNSPCEQCGGTR